MARELFRRGEHTLLRCATCGLVRLEPRPRAGDDRVHDIDHYDDVMAPLQAGFAQAHEALLEDVVRRVPPPARLLDVGAADGALVARACARGFDAWGLEPSPGAASARVVAGALETSTAFDDNPFDVVLAIQMIEHTLDPVWALRRLRELLRPGGLAYVETPSFDALPRRLGRRSWWDMNVGVGHWQLFTPETFARAADEAGLELVSSTTFFKGMSWQRPLARALLRGLNVAIEPTGAGSNLGVWLARR